MFAPFINYRSLPSKSTSFDLLAVKKLTVLLTLIAAMCIATPANAYLGGFEPADGYTLSAIPQGSSPASLYSDVTYYNAGQSGANAGGGVPTVLAPDTGLWMLLTQPGAFFRNSATRSSYTGGAPTVWAVSHSCFWRRRAGLHRRPPQPRLPQPLRFGPP